MIRDISQVTDIVALAKKLKWNWEGHVVGMQHGMVLSAVCSVFVVLFHSTVIIITLLYRFVDTSDTFCSISLHEYRILKTYLK